MSQTELAERSEIAESTISEILAGKRKLSRRHIAAFSMIFRVSPAVFFSETIETTPSQQRKSFEGDSARDRRGKLRSDVAPADGSTKSPSNRVFQGSVRRSLCSVLDHLASQIGQRRVA